MRVEILRETFKLARQSVDEGGLPFAAILWDGTEVVSASKDLRHLESDPTAHPEMTVIRDYCRRTGEERLSTLTLYSNVEPCVMCAAAIYWAYVGNVVFSVTQESLRLLSDGPPRPTAASIANREGAFVGFSGPHLAEEGLIVLKSHPAFQQSVDQEGE